MPVKNVGKHEADEWIQKLLQNRSQDPAPAFKFWVELDGILVGVFTECSGLNASRVVEQYKEGGVNDHVHMLPGQIQYTNIQLKRGITLDNQLWNWYEVGIHTGLARDVKVSILLYNQHGDLVRRWEVPGAYPVKWVGPTLSTASNQLAVEMLEIAPQGSIGTSSGSVVARKEADGAATPASASPTPPSPADKADPEAVNVDALAQKIFKMMWNDVRMDLERRALRDQTNR